MVATRRRRRMRSLSGDKTASLKRRSNEDAPDEQRRSPSPPGKTTMGADTGYEKLREERIRENLERMQKLGIVDLSLQVRKSQQQISHRRGAAAAAAPRSPIDPSKLLAPALPNRRSSRLQNVAPVSYSEDLAGNANDEKVRKRTVFIEGQKEEVYTEEHEKLLGTCETSWTLFVDGYDKDGKRVYDQITGKTCHQCRLRQKTLGHHTHCSKCNLVQGQFCGDCLYMRYPWDGNFVLFIREPIPVMSVKYGENVLEVKKNPNWICPVCRGICNCSLCRVKKGWAPTGALYRKVLSLGFKSVAHFLVQTRRLQAISDAQIPDTSSKNLLPFTDEDFSHKLDSSLTADIGLNSVPCDKENKECNVKCSLTGANDAEPSETANLSPDSMAARLRKRHKG